MTPGPVMGSFRLVSYASGGRDGASGSYFSIRLSSEMQAIKIKHRITCRL